MNHIFVQSLTICLFSVAVNMACSDSPSEQATSRSSSVSAGAPSQLQYEWNPGWIEETPSSRMRRAQYRLPQAESDSEAAQLIVYYFGGQGGSVDANIDRWVGQLRHADGSPLSRSDAKVSTRSVSGLKVTIVDAQGTYRSSSGPMMTGSPKPGFRMLAAVVETPMGPWFFKLTGPQRTVGKWESSFSELIDSLRLEP